MNKFEVIFNEWRVKLQLENCPIKFRILDESEELSLTQTGYKAMMRWDNRDSEWELISPKEIDKTIFIHELGHIYFPKIINDMRLAPSKMTKDIAEKLNYEIAFCVNQLIDCFINHYLSEFNEYYYSWVNTMAKNLKIKHQSEWGLYKIIAFYLLHYIEYKYLFRDKERLSYDSEIKLLIKHTEDVIKSRHRGQEVIINSTKLFQLKILLDKFNSLKDNKDSNKILDFMLEIIRHLGLWDNKTIDNFFKIRFIHD